VPDSRRFVTLALTEVPAATREVVELLVSELATNAVTHAQSEFAVSVATTRDSIRVEVVDQGSGLPAPREPSVTDLHGRGLHIVEELADAWGSDVIGDRGKSIWFVVNVSDHRP
jgi:anti-sigma regulatory factor (Ser/Thr protein kinase)